MDGLPRNGAPRTQLKERTGPVSGQPGAREDAGTTEIINRALDSAREILGMDLAFLSDTRQGLQDFRCVSGDGASFDIHEGESIPLEGTYCELLLGGRLKNIVADSQRDPLVRDLAGTESGRVGSYIGVPVTEADGRVYGTFCCVSHDANAGLGERDVQFLQLLARLIGDQLEREAFEDEKRRLANVGALLVALEARDGYTGDHSEAVVELAVTTGHALGLSDAELADLDAAARLHDIGKIAISDSILRKPGKLNPAEWEEMQRHPGAGADLVSAIPGLAHLAPLIRSEHERWDGGGYPDGLSGEEIPLVSRIVLVCDAYHAMTSDRPYRPAMSPEAALAELQRHRGAQFCPTCVDAVMGVLTPAAPVAA